MRGKPYLQIEVDEHSADVGSDHPAGGFLDSIKRYREDNTREGRKTEDRPPHQRCQPPEIVHPYMAEAGLRVVGAFQACGIDAEVTPKANQETVFWGKKVYFGQGMLSLHPDDRRHGGG